MVGAAGNFRLLAEDHTHVGETSVVQPRARHCSARPALARLGIGKVEGPVPLELGIEHDVEEATLTAVIDRRNVGEWCGKPVVYLHQAQLSAALGHEFPTVRQEGKAPRVVKASRDRIDPDPFVLGDEFLRAALAGCAEH
jgi:hypothetical protein